MFFAAPLKPRIASVLFLLSLSAGGPSVYGKDSLLTHGCEGLFQSGRGLSREVRKALIARLKRPHEPGEYGVRIVTDEDVEGEERPDPERPYPVRLPDGKQIYLIGLSGQRVLYAESLRRLADDGVAGPTARVHLFNEHGHPYGEEIEESTGEPMRYAFNSSVWDLSFFRLNGELWGAAGAMANHAEGHPMTVGEGANNTRQRKLFRFEWMRDPASPVGYSLRGRAMSAPFNQGLPSGENWIEQREGKTVFRHGYGGNPVFLQNGELYTDTQGRVPFVKEQVWEQTVSYDDSGNVTGYEPALTVITLTWMDASLTHVLEGPKVLISPKRPDGSVYEAAKRPGVGDLVEGAHIQVNDREGRPIASRAELEMYRRAGGIETFSADFSAGFFNGHYGSFRAEGEGRLENLRVIEDEHGELEDLTRILRPLFTWIGRPVTYHLEDGREMVMIHAVALASLDEECLAHTHQPPPWHLICHFRRQLLTFPVERYRDSKGVIRRRILDNTGLMDVLRSFGPAVE